MSKETLTITDNRTGKTYEVPIEHDTIPAIELRQIKVHEDDFGMMTYDPGYKNTASTKSTITYISGSKGILEYRGYPIDQIAANSNYLEAAYLILFGELPTRDELTEWEDSIRYHTLIHENMKELFEAFRYDAHPMGMLISSVAALSTYYPEAKNVLDPENRMLQIKRLIAKMPTLAAFAYRFSMGFPVNYPDNELSYAGNFLNMMFKMVEPKYDPDPALERALDILFILHADHEQNAGTTAMRVVGSTLSDPYSAVAAAAAALYGPRHGGANEAVLQMLEEIGDLKNVPAYVERVKNGEFRLMGFGHRVYKNYDPRARIIKQAADDVFEVTGHNPLLDIALELERIALEDDYFVSRSLYPNVDFYSGIIYQAMGLPTSMFPVMFAIPRTIGWLAQWQELLEDSEQAIARPRQIFLGERNREYVPIDERS
jgi:citrate synthase